MKYLIDTHILIWWLDDNDRLSNKVRNIIENHSIWVSTAAIWEIVIKSNIGKIELPGSISDALSDNEFQVLDIKFDHILKLQNLSDHHADPFDRVQIAQAMVEGFIFVSADKKVWNYKEAQILRN